jgi:AcrR family transcriptional regulator
LKAALYLFSKKGFYNTKMEEIADKALISKGLLYFYFDSKEKILEEIMNSIYKDFIPKLESILKLNLSSLERLKKFIKFEFEFYKKNKRFVKLIYEIFHEEIYFLRRKFPFFKEIHLKEKEILEKIIEEGIKEGIFKKIDPEFGCFLLSSIFHYVFLKGTILKDYKEIAEIFLKGILKNEKDC